MPFHLLGYSASVANGTAYVDFTGVSDGVFQRRNGHYLFGEDLLLFAAFAMSTNLEKARIVTPSLRATAPAQIRPIVRAATQGTDPNLAEFLDAPLQIHATEEIAVEARHTAGAPETVRALLWVTKGLVPKPSGSVITMRGTTSGTLLAEGWALPTVVWEDELPRGRYAVVGSEAYGDNAIAHRWIFDDLGFRPGALSSFNSNAGERTHRYFYGGQLGVWGYFHAPVMPRLEVFSTSASGLVATYLQVIRIG